MKKFAAKAASIVFSAVFFSILGLTGYADYYDPSQWFDQREGYLEQRNTDVFIILGILAAVVVVIVLIVRAVKRNKNSHNSDDSDTQASSSRSADTPVYRENSSITAMFCRKCGKQIDDASVFCCFCGADLSVGIHETEEQRIEREYAENSNKLAQAKALMDNKQFEDARRIFLEISGFKNADELAEKCLTDARDFRRHSAYLHAKAVLEQEHPTVEQIDSAREDFEALEDYLDSALN